MYYGTPLIYSCLQNLCVLDFALGAAPLESANEIHGHGLWSMNLTIPQLGVLWSSETSL